MFADSQLIETPSVLISDDDREFRETMRFVLEPRGFRTLLASDGEEALRLVLTETVHLALLDMHMPKWTGLDVLRRVKKFREQIPCILMSAALDEHLRCEAERAKAFSVLAKPISRDTITSTVEQAMRRTYRWPGDPAAS